MKKKLYREYDKRRIRNINNLNKKYKTEHLKIEFKEVINFQGQSIYVIIVDGGREKGNAKTYYNRDIVVNSIKIRNVITIDKSLYDRVSEDHYRFIIGHELGHIKIVMDDNTKNDNIGRRRDFLTEVICDLYSINRTNFNMDDIKIIIKELEDMKIFNPEFKRRFRLIRKILNKNLTFDSIYKDYKRYNYICIESKEREKELTRKRSQEIRRLNDRGEYYIPYIRSNRIKRIEKIIRTLGY